MKIWESGGTGTLGKELVSQVYDQADRIVIYSRDEAKQALMGVDFPEYPDNKIRYHIGDVRDYRRVRESMSGCDIVIHTAALKRIDTCESNVFEAESINVQGTINVVRAAIDLGIKKLVFISTDKACMSVSTYGDCKALCEKIVTNANNYGQTNCYCVRYGNVLGSRGSVLGIWEDQVKAGKPVTVTDTRMTRFFWAIKDAAKFILDTLPVADRGVIYVPKMRKYRIMDMAKLESSNIVETGLRCTEKLHEDLISPNEGMHTYDEGRWYAIHPVLPAWGGSKPKGDILNEPVTSYIKENADDKPTFHSTEALPVPVPASKGKTKGSKHLAQVNAKL